MCGQFQNKRLQQDHVDPGSTNNTLSFLTLRRKIKLNPQSCQVSLDIFDKTSGHFHATLLSTELFLTRRSASRANGEENLLFLMTCINISQQC